MIFFSLCLGLASSQWTQSIADPQQGIEVPFPCREAVGSMQDSEFQALADVFPKCEQITEMYHDQLIDFIVKKRLLHLYSGYDGLKPKEGESPDPTSQFWDSSDRMAPVCNPMCEDGLQWEPRSVEGSYRSLHGKNYSEFRAYDSPTISLSHPDQFLFEKTYQRTHDLSPRAATFVSYPLITEAESFPSAYQGKSCTIMTERGYSWKDLEDLFDADQEECSDSDDNWATIDQNGASPKTLLSQADEQSVACEKRITLHFNDVGPWYCPPGRVCDFSASLAPYYSGFVAQATWAALSRAIFLEQIRDDLGSAGTVPFEKRMKLKIYDPELRPLAEQYLESLRKAGRQLGPQIRDERFKEKVRKAVDGWKIGRQYRLESQRQSPAGTPSPSVSGASSDADVLEGDQRVGQLFLYVQELVFNLVGNQIVYLSGAQVLSESQDAVRSATSGILGEDPGSGDLRSVIQLMRDRAIVFCGYFPAAYADEGYDQDPIEMSNRDILRALIERGFGIVGAGALDQVLVNLPWCMHWKFLTSLRDAMQEQPSLKNLFRENSGYSGEKLRVYGHQCLMSEVLQ